MRRGTEGGRGWALRVPGALSLTVLTALGPQGLAFSPSALRPFSPASSRPLSNSSPPLRFPKDVLPNLVVPQSRALRIGCIRLFSTKMQAEEEVPRVSVTGVAYEGPEGSPKVTLFTKDGCTLCDKVKDVLEGVTGSEPHSLHKVDITDPEHEKWWDM